MSEKQEDHGEDPGRGSCAERRVRSDAQRNLEALLLRAKELFASSGVDVPVREIAEKAGVGIGTFYRHFPRRSDLVAAVFRHELDACADAAPVLAAKYEPGEALDRWIQRYVDFIATKRGLAAALRSGDPVYSGLPTYFDARIRPAFQSLLGAAVKSGEVRSDVGSDELLDAIRGLCMSVNDVGAGNARRMVALLVDGLRCKKAGR
jgi:AcrR family transcriptional regulator